VPHQRDRAIGPRAEFLAGLDPGSKDDWVRAALGEPSKAD
jgi:hypothetical protein